MKQYSTFDSALVIGPCNFSPDDEEDDEEC
jgi:hypothetical protein